jgi:arylformamidase
VERAPQPTQTDILWLLMMLHELSHVIRQDMLVYPGDPAPRVRRLTSIEDGAPLTASSLDLPCHAGTHVDAPAHFLAGGRPLSDYAIEDFCGPALVLDFAAHDNVTAEAVRTVEIPEGRHLLLKTRNSRRAPARLYDQDHAFVDPEAAEALLARQPRSIGFDDYSIDAFADPGLTVHRRFAAAGRLVYVQLDLSSVAAGEYVFFGLPLRVDGVEAAPVRAVLWRP